MKFLIKLFSSIIITATLFIVFSTNPKAKEYFYNNIYDKTLNFAYFNNIYKKISGIKDIDTTKAVFSNKLDYKDINKYKDGIALNLNNPLVPLISNGIVIDIKKTTDYGKVIVVQNKDGVNITYGNLSSVDVALYDYLEQGSYLGTTNKLYMTFEKDGVFLNYEEFNI